MIQFFTACHFKTRIQGLWLLFFCLACIIAGMASAQAGTPTFSAAFSPTTIAPGSVSTLTYTIDNSANDTSVLDVAFSNALPAGVTLASPVNITDSCNGVVAATAGSSSVSYSLDRFGLGQTCVISVDVTSSTAGTYSNTTGDLTSSEGNSGNASASLTVDGSIPQLSIAVSPSTIAPEAVSTLTYTFDNSNNGSDMAALHLNSVLPDGVVVSDQPNPATNCTVVSDYQRQYSGVTVTPGSNAVRLGYFEVPAGGSCTASFDITASSVGAYSIDSGMLYNATVQNFGSITLVQNPVSLGVQNTTLLSIERSLLNISAPASASPGQTITLTFDLLNNNRDQDITNLSFTNDLNAALSGLAATALPADGFCGSGSVISGSSSLSVSGVSLASGASCSFDVSVLIPANAAAGSYTNTTSSIAYDLGGSATTGTATSNIISIYKAPTVNMSFIDDPVVLGGDVTLRYTVANTDTTNALSDATFQLGLNNQISGMLIKTLPAANSCGSGSTFSQQTISDTAYFVMAGGALSANDSCTFDLVLTVPSNGNLGDFDFTTSNISGTVASESLFGNTASDTLSVIGAPALAISLSSVAALPGDTVTATFTLDYSANAVSDATNVGFTLDLDAALTGLVSTTGTTNDVCGSGSAISGSSLLTLAGGSLSPGDSCTFSLSLQIPVTAASGSVSLDSSVVSATVSSTSVSYAAASQSLLISGLTASKTFLTNPVLPGSQSTLRYTFANSANAAAATAIEFTDSLTSVISTMAASSLPATPCGSGSSLSGTTQLSFSGGELQPGDTCTFDVPVNIPAGATDGTYTSTSSTVSATVNSSLVTAGAINTTLAVETLTVNLSSTASNPTSGPTIPVAISFSRDVINFEAADLVVGNGSVTDFAGSGSNYTAEITPTSDGAVTIDLPANAVDDAVDNTVKNPVATQLSVTYESVPAIADPVIAIGSPDASSTNTGPVTYTVSYTDTTQVNLTTTAIALNKTGTANATVSVTNGDTDTATVTLSSITGDGSLGISIGSGTARNSTKVAGNAGPSGTFTVDNTQPGVTITSSLLGSSFNNSSFTATFTFTEAVSGFVIGDISAGNASLSNFSAVSTSVYTATVTPDEDGLVTLDVAAGTAQDSVGNSNTGATQYQATYDSTSPTLAITSDIVGTATNGSFTAIFTFSEPVTGFSAADVTAVNASVGTLSATSSSVYTAKISPTNEGVVTLDVSANAAQDSVGNNNTAATQLGTIYDTTAPTVVITANSGALTNSAFTATVTFSEDVSNFNIADIVADNAILTHFNSTSASVYTLTVTPISDGAVTLNIASSVAQDSAGNNNSAATQFSTSYDATTPTVAITANSGSLTNGSFTATFTFSEAVSGFTAADITAANASVSVVSVTSSSVYTATITPVADGSVTLDVASNVAQDSAGNGNTAATQFSTSYDATAPTVTISAGSGSLTNAAFTATFTFSEPVSGFTAADVTASNATVGVISATSSSVYTATITPTADGTVTLDVAGNVAQDSAGNGNTAATQFRTSYDATAPTVAITANSGTDTNAAFTATFTFSEAVTGFTVSDIVVANAILSSFNTTSSSVYTVTVTPSADGMVTLDIAGNVAQDGAGNGNTAATQFSTSYDATAPSLAITADSGSLTNAAFTATFTFTEAVSGFTAADVTASNATVGAVSATSSSVYTATITPIADGSVTLNVAGNVAQDSAGNGNTVATQFSTSYDATAPTLAITADSGSLTNAAFTATFTFSEPVSGFTAADVTASNASVGVVSASSSSVYTATITPTADGSVTLNVAGNVAQDSAGNGNTVATQFSTSYDATAPTVAITADSGSLTNAAFTATFTFSEPVSGFAAADVTASNASVGVVSASSSSVYTATITPTADGSVTLNVAGNVAQDSAGNGNTAATQFSTSYDATAPTVAITADSGSLTNAAFTATFTFSEPVSSFTAADVSAGNATVGVVSAINSSVYTATITPSADGTVTLNVAGDVAQDNAGNGNTAAAKFSTSYDATAPTVAITADSGEQTNAAFTATFTFSEAVIGFNAADITVSNATVSGFSATSSSVYTALMTPTSDGLVTLEVAANRAQDAAGNANTAATQFSTLYDATAPSLAITADSGSLTNAAFTATFTFSESVSGFTMAAIMAGNASISNFAQSGSSVYTATVTPENDGAVTLDVAADVAQDSAGNGNTAAKQFSTLYDNSVPSVVITAEVSEVTNAPFTATFTFSEAVNGFTMADITVTNAAVSAVSATSSSVYNATISPSVEGQVTVDVAANVVQDAAGNSNTAATTFTVDYDATQPQLLSSSPKHEEMDVANNRLQVSLTFDEDIRGDNGNIDLVRQADNTVVETLSLAGDSVTITAKVLKASFASKLAQNEAYSIVINSGNISDVAGNAWSGLATDALVFTAANEPPGNNDDTATVDEDSEVIIPVLANDEDLSDGLDITSVTIDTNPLQGSVSVDSQTGEVTYKPEANFNGVDSFTYVVSDTQGSTSEPATVTVTVNAINDEPVAASDTVSTTEEQQLVIDILSNDTDIDEQSNLDANAIDPATVVIIDDVDNGTLVIVDAQAAADDSSLQVGQVIYSPDVNFFGTDVFTYSVRDTLGAVSADATVTISVGAVNDQPVATDDSATTNEDEAVIIDVVGNDSDSENNLNEQSVIVVSQGNLGSASVNSNTGEVTYTPDANVFGTDSFLYTVADQQGLVSASAKVTVTIIPVNDAPVVTDDYFEISTREPMVLDVLSNDSDPDTISDVNNRIDPGSVAVVMQPAQGSVTINDVTGAISYTPDDEATVTTDSFSYQVMDFEGELSGIATVEISLQLKSVSLVANNDSTEANEDTAVTLNILANDGDPTRTLDVSGISVTEPASNGVTQVNSNGTVTYTPNTDFYGEDIFAYTVRDTDGDVSNEATVTITVIPVNDAPGISGTPVTSVIAGNTYQFVPNATDIDSSLLIFSIQNAPPWSTFNPTTGVLTGAPEEEQAGAYENIVLTVTDEEGASTSLPAFSIEVTSKDSLSPKADSISVEVEEDGSVTFTVSATDPNDQPLTFEIVGQPMSGEISGTLPLVTYTPEEDFFGDDSFTFTASNGEYTSSPAMVSVLVSPVNDAPTAVDDEATVVSGSAVIIDVLNNDTDVDDESLTVISANSSQGSLTVVENQLNYTAEENFSGRVVIDYTVEDSEGLTASAQVVVTVTSDDNSGAALYLTVPEDVEVDATGLITRVSLGLAQASDEDGNAIPVSLQTPPFFRPGKHSVIWQAERGDEIVQGSQLVTVHPLVNIDKAQRVEEGRSATIKVVLNGPAPEYPVFIPYTISGTSDNGDHNLYDDTLVINSGMQGTISVDTVNDSLTEGDETLVVTLSPSLNVANSQHTLTIVETVLAPKVQLSALQDGQSLTTIYPQAGMVDVYLTLENREASEIAYVDWSASSADLPALNISAEPTLFRFSPETLTPGVYWVEAKVTDVNGLTGTAQALLKLNAETPELGGADTDGDGIADNEEGYADNDGDGIPNYLDAYDSCEVQVFSLTPGNTYLAEGDTGPCLILGDVALATSNSLVINEHSLPSDTGFIPVNPIVNFIVSGLNEIGSSYSIVIPQQNVIPAGAVYRKYHSVLQSWQDFELNGVTDAIHSAKGEPGICPPLDAQSWTEGLTEGHWCIRLTISDGGPNDDDGVANGIIVDPSVLSVMSSENQKPVAQDDELFFKTTTLAVLNVLANDSDVDSDTLTLVSANAYLGSVEIVNNELIYEPPSAFIGQDSLVYAVSDGNGGVAMATATLNVNINRGPQLQDDTARMNSKGTIVVDVLANDIDPDGDVLTITDVTASGGTVAIQNNEISYTPVADMAATVTIIYTATDGEQQVSATLTVYVSNPQPSNGGSLSAYVLGWLLMILIYRLYSNSNSAQRPGKRRVL